MNPVQRLAALFAGNETHYGTHGEPSRKPGTQKWIIQPTAATLNGKVTAKMWEDHVAGVRPIGIVPIKQDSTAVWGSIDYDVYGEDLTKLIKKVEAAKLPLVPCRSKSGGLHLFFFTLEPIPAAMMAQVLRNLAAALGIADSEIFPKQGELLSNRGDKGTWMVMPYFGGDFGGKLKMQVGLTADGKELKLADFLRFAEKMRQTTEAAEQLMHVSAAPVQAKPKRGSKEAGTKGDKGPMPGDDLSKPYGDGPPCLTHMVLAGGVPGGGQNNALCHMATYYKRKFPDTWREELTTANATHLNPPGSDAGLDSVIKSYSKKDYDYKCKDEPMRTHCDSVACRARRFGVTGGTMAPLITSIKKLDSDPPLWFVSVDDKQIECTTDDLQRWDRFQKKLIEQTHNPYGMIPHPLWLATIGVALAGMNKDDIIPVSKDAGIGGEFHELLETFLTNKQRAAREEDLLSDRPWEDEEQKKYYFNLGKLQRYLKKEGMEGMKRPQILARIREDFGGDHELKTVKGTALHLHWIPSDKVRAKPKASIPELKEKPI